MRTPKDDIKAAMHAAVRVLKEVAFGSDRRHVEAN
jgi:hypothetical protein